MKNALKHRSALISILATLALGLGACGPQGVTPTVGGSSNTPLTLSEASGAVMDELCLAGDQDGDLRCDETEQRSDNVDCSNPNDPGIDSRACMLDDYYDAFGLDDDGSNPNKKISPWLKVMAGAAGAYTAYILAKGTVTGIWNPFTPFNFTNNSGQAMIKTVIPTDKDEVTVSNDSRIITWKKGAQNHILIYDGILDGPVAMVKTSKGTTDLPPNRVTCVHGVDLGVTQYTTGNTFKMTVRIPGSELKKTKGPITYSQVVDLDLFCKNNIGIFVAMKKTLNSPWVVTKQSPRDWGNFSVTSASGNITYALNMFLDISTSALNSNSLTQSNLDNVTLVRFNETDPTIRTGEYKLTTLSNDRIAEINAENNIADKVKKLLSTSSYINQEAVFKMSTTHTQELIAAQPNLWIKSSEADLDEVCDFFTNEQALDYLDGLYQEEMKKVYCK
ncbi:MAG: hypothetical protein R3A11_06165 [Bdellovibrionota bacterium]